MKEKNWIQTYLTRVPYQAESGAVLFHTAFDGVLAAAVRDGVGRHTLPWDSPESYHLWKDRKIREEFLSDWNSRYCPGEWEYRNFPWLADAEVSAFLDRIAADGEPVLDLASDFCMGMLPFLLQRNPTLAVCASDMDAGSMETLADCLRIHLPDFAVDTAAFDNNDIPIRDAALRVVTGIDAIRSSVDPEGDECRWANFLGRERMLREVYRILAPGGFFLADEMSVCECDWEAETLYETCAAEKLYGILTLPQVQAAMDNMVRDCLRVAAETVGFTVRLEKKYLRRLRGKKRKQRLLRYAGMEAGLSAGERQTERDDPDIGLEIYEGTVFCVFQKL